MPSAAASMQARLSEGVGIVVRATIARFLDGHLTATPEAR